MDSGLYENLRSFFQLDYPQFEILFSIEDEADPARPVVEKLLTEYPEVPARLLISQGSLGRNPKVNNMASSYQAAKYDWILISDSNVRVGPDYLKDFIESMRNPRVGLVTSLIAGVAPEGFSGKLEAMFLNAFAARGMVMALSAGKPVVVGKSMLFRRSVAARFGGLAVLARFLAEDYMAGIATKQLGLQVTIAHAPIQQYLGEYSLKQFWLRHVRWGRLRRMQAPLIFPFEPLQNALVTALIGAVWVAPSLSLSFMQFFLLHLSVWATIDLTLAVRVAGLRAFSPSAWLVRELLVIPLYVQIYGSRSVQWRGRRLNLGLGGVLE